MLLSDSSPQSASVVASSMPPYTKRSTALAPAAVSLLFRSAAVSDGAIEMVTVFSALAEREVGLIHGMSGSGGYVGGTRLMSEGRDFLGRVLAWCLVALAWTWWATAQERDQIDVRAARTVCGRPGRREQSSQGVCARRECCAAARVVCSLEMNCFRQGLQGCCCGCNGVMFVASSRASAHHNLAGEPASAGSGHPQGSRPVGWAARGLCSTCGGARSPTHRGALTTVS